MQIQSDRSVYLFKYPVAPNAIEECGNGKAEERSEYRPSWSRPLSLFQRHTHCSSSVHSTTDNIHITNATAPSLCLR